MKKILILVFALACYKASAQDYRPLAEFGDNKIDYLQYNFIDRKDQYLGKPFGSLLNDYELPLVLVPLSNSSANAEELGGYWFHAAFVRYPYQDSKQFGHLTVLFRSPWIPAVVKKNDMIVFIDEPENLHELLKDCIVDKIELDVQNIRSPDLQ